MSRPMWTCAALVAALLASAACAAPLFRAYVSASGNDLNPCNLPQPCRLLPAALLAVADGGEIWMLNSANYNTGTVTIGKSVSILAVPGAIGSIVAVNGGPAISVTGTSITVALRNVSIGPVAGGTPGTHGVDLSALANVTIENSLIANLPGAGVRVSSVPGTVRVLNSTLRNNDIGVYVDEGGLATISSSQLLGNTTAGVSVSNFSTATFASITNCVISGGNAGVQVTSGGGTAPARASVTRTTIEKAATGLVAFTNIGVGLAEINIGGSLLVNNSQAYSRLGGGATIYTLGDNQMSGNGAPFGATTSLAGQ